MKKLLQIAVIAAVALGLANAGVAADQKIATVDLQKVFEKYYKTIRSTASLKQEAAEMQKERKEIVDAGRAQQTAWQNLIDKAEDQAASAEERARSKKAAEVKLNDVKSAEQTIQAFDRQATTKLQEKERLRRDDIVKEIRSVLDSEAKAGGYTLVLDVSGESANMAPVVLFSSGANDLTESLLKELNAGAPPMPVDDKDAKGAK
jgi:outer membrane protein